MRSIDGDYPENSTHWDSDEQREFCLLDAQAESWLVLPEPTDGLDSMFGEGAGTKPAVLRNVRRAICTLQRKFLTVARGWVPYWCYDTYLC